MPLIIGFGETASHHFSDEDWRRFLPGDCLLARKILPYLVYLVEEEPSLEVSEVDEYDRFMAMHVMLVFTMVWSVKSHDVRWLADRELTAMLKEFESEAGGKQEQCEQVMRRMNAFLFMDEWMNPRGVWECAADLLGPVEGGSQCSTREVGEIVDGSNVGILKDVFYVTTGTTTTGEEGGGTTRRDKAHSVEGLPMKVEGERKWTEVCLTMDSLECRAGMCLHFTGLALVARAGDGEAEGRRDEGE